MKAPAEASACRACGAPGREIFRKRGYAVAECGSCGARYIPQGVELPRYDEAYFAAGRSDAGYGGYLDDSALVQANFARRVEWFLPLTAGRRLLDVGAAYGFLLAAAHKAGFVALGVEPAPQCAEFARRELGVEIRTGSIEEVSLEPESFDVVTMFDVIEHLEDPAAVVRRVRSLLRPGGLLVVETGDVDASLARALGSNWYFYDPPQHVTFFGRRSLEALLVRSGFTPAVAIAHLGRSVSLRNFAFQLGRALGNGVAGEASRRIARSSLGRIRFRVPDRGNAFALSARRADG
jgi:SAM-dependent methyltransferase